MDTSINIVNLSYQSLKKRIKKNEGFSSNPYKDQLGFFTIGFGHLILKSERYLIQKKISKKNLDKIFSNDFNRALSDFNYFLKSFSFNSQNSEVLIEMIFQMGIDRVLKFKKLLNYMKRKEKNLVCFEMMNSLWYKQTPIRVKKLVKIILKK